MFVEKPVFFSRMIYSVPNIVADLRM